MRSKLFLSIMVAAVSAGAINVRAQASPASEKHPFTYDDFIAVRSTAPIAMSPDGKLILHDIVFRGQKGPFQHEYHVMAVSGEGDRKLELPEHFRPSGFATEDELFGTLPVNGQAQLAIVPLDPAKPARILALPTGIESAAISPDGSRFAVLANPRTKDPLAGVHQVIEPGETSLYVIGADGNGGAWWCPALRNITQIAWSPDGSQIAVVSASPKLGHHDVRTQIEMCSSSGPKRVAEIANATAGLAWADGGKTLVFASTSTPVLTPDHLWTVPASGGTAVDRTPNESGSIIDVLNDSRGRVWLNVHHGVHTTVEEFRDGKVQPGFEWPDGVPSEPVFPRKESAPDVLVFGVADPTHAANIAVAHGSDLERITHEGDDALAKVNFGEVRVVNWTAKDGIRLEGILTFPADYQPGQKRPFVVLPHGGPESNDVLRLDNFSRIVAGLGYVVLQPEYRGSTGFGSDFLAAIYQHFGDRAYSDVDSATDFAIAQGWADPNRLAIFGWSAGGFMTSWTVTQTRRYKAAIEGAGITDWLSFIPTSDVQQVDFDARMQELDPKPMLQFSAVMYADKVTTPLLILHGAADIRVPTFQGLEFYALLAERGKTVRMVTYPGSPHFPVLVEQQKDVFKEVGDWLK
ncbi:MAG TPA: S9 family peptidase, partial [Candidatus Acidoferrales bacterium]|nr:S9 family peptidase [Candidatus Acidoferrales bacterium]